MHRIELKIPPLLLTLLMAGGMWALARYLPGQAVDIPWRYPIAGLLGVAGLGFAGAGVLAFRQARTTVDPTRPHAVSEFVVSGVYRISRNPMYLGFLLGLAAWAVFLEHGLAFLGLPAFVLHLNRFQIVPEERALSERFGNEYAEYKKSVRRWL